MDSCIKSSLLLLTLVLFQSFATDQQLYPPIELCNGTICVKDGEVGLDSPNCNDTLCTKGGFCHVCLDGAKACFPVKPTAGQCCGCVLYEEFLVFLFSLFLFIVAFFFSFLFLFFTSSHRSPFGFLCLFFVLFSLICVSFPFLSFPFSFFSFWFSAFLSFLSFIFITFSITHSETSGDCWMCDHASQCDISRVNYCFRHTSNVGAGVGILLTVLFMIIFCLFCCRLEFFCF